ncbi:MAG: sugar phosphate isomerase/epimerase [Clostridia bacterium]|nr:sugar phosphate isomerase/epimerase [Clostridia bacterium]
MEYGIQMYSIRDLASKDLDAALGAVAEIGYKYVEFAGFFGHTAEEVRAMLDKHGLKVSGTHTQFGELEEDFEGTVQFHKIIGNKNIIVPGYDLTTKEKIDAYVEKCNAMLPRLAAEGIRLGHHNHSAEFLPVEGVLPEVELETRTDIMLELDTYWAFNAGEDPIAWMKRLYSEGKLSVIHLKDGFVGGRGVALGEGEAPVAAVRALAEELGITIVVESEGLDPTGREEVERCFKYLSK